MERLGWAWRIRAPGPMESIPRNARILEARMSLVDERTLEQAALQLLASSTSQRYAREAARIAEEAGLVAAAQKNPRAYYERLDELLPIVTESEGSPAELEVALLLCALARNDNERRLRQLIEPSRMRSPWLTALAFRIPQFGPPTITEFDELHQRIERLLEGSVEAPSSLDVRDNSDPHLFPRAA